jgi:hypothetical protein
MRPQLGDGFSWTERGIAPALVCRALEAHADHLFTTRAWPLGVAETDPGAAARAWADVAAAFDVPPGDLRRARQVHGSSVVVVGSDVPRESDVLPDADILITADRAFVLAVQAADCVPLLIADSRAGGVAAAHAGWRGLAAGVPRVAVRALTGHFGSRPGDLVIALGPSISAARYEVGEDVRRAFESAGYADRIPHWFPAQTRPGHWLFDGWQAARDQLVMAGADAARIHASGLCSYTHADVCCSYRRDGRAAGRMAAAIRVRSPG